MRRDLTSGVLVIAMLAAMGAVGGAQDQPPAASVDWRQWDEGPEGFLLTKDEAKEWKAITTEAEAKRSSSCSGRAETRTRTSPSTPSGLSSMRSSAMPTPTSRTRASGAR